MEVCDGSTGKVPSHRSNSRVCTADGLLVVRGVHGQRRTCEILLYAKSRENHDRCVPF